MKERRGHKRSLTDLHFRAESVLAIWVSKTEMIKYVGTKINITKMKKLKDFNRVKEYLCADRHAE